MPERDRGRRYPMNVPPEDRARAVIKKLASEQETASRMADVFNMLIQAVQPDIVKLRSRLRLDQTMLALINDELGYLYAMQAAIANFAPGFIANENAEIARTQAHARIYQYQIQMAQSLLAFSEDMQKETAKFAQSHADEANRKKTLIEANKLGGPTAPNRENKADGMTAALGRHDQLAAELRIESIE